MISGELGTHHGRRDGLGTSRQSLDRMEIAVDPGSLGGLLAMVVCGLVYRTPIPVQASQTTVMMSRRKFISRVAALATAAAVTWGTVQAPAQAQGGDIVIFA